MQNAQINLEFWCIYLKNHEINFLQFHPFRIQLYPPPTSFPLSLSALLCV